MRFIFKTVLLLFLCATVNQAYTQKLRFQDFNESDGIASKFCYTVGQYKNGQLLVSTNDGILQYDGSEFIQVVSNDTLANNFARCSFIDSKGTLWFGHNQGGVSFYKGDELTYLELDTTQVSRINDIVEDDKGNTWVLSQSSGLFKISQDKEITRYFEGLDMYYLYSLSFLNDKIYIGSDMGLLSLKFDSEDAFTIKEYSEIPMTKVSSLNSFEDRIYIGTEDQGCYVLETRDSEHRIGEIIMDGLNLSEYKICSLRKDEYGDLWIGSENKGLIQLIGENILTFNSFRDFSECGLSEVKCVYNTFSDREGNLWIASLDGGLLKLVESFFSFYSLEDFSENTNANFIYSNAKNELWIGSKNSIVHASVSPWEKIKIYTIDEKNPKQQIISISKDDMGNTWAGSSIGGLYLKKKQSDRFQKVNLDENSSGKRINHIQNVGSFMFVSTADGVFLFEDGILQRKLTLSDGLPDDYINKSIFDGQSKVWFVSKIHGDGDNVAYFDLRINKIVQVFKVSRTKENTSIAIDSEGDIWVGSKGGGLVNFNGTETTVYNTVNSGLFKNFIYSIAIDSKDQIWASHRGGLSKMNNKNEIKIYEEFEIDNFSFLEHSACSDFEGDVWFGTDLGLIRYSPDSDRISDAAPILQIQPIVIDDEMIFSPDEKITLPYNGDYKIEVEFLAISLKNSSDIKYQYYLEGLNNDWEDFTYKNKEIYDKLDPGEYTFKVRAVNSDGVSSEEIKEVKFFIDSPFWWKWWFYLLVGCFIFVIVREVVKRRERFYIKNQEYLQSELDARTKEVVEQKEILERTNLDITDSIEYAKKIQTAILPPPKSLNRLFTDAFVFYKPRDIVSGDFYWVWEFEEHVLVACADCTGHGVPGAFMSLIGTALLKEISHHRDVMSPAQALECLDEEIQLLLNKEDSSFGVSDGMDISLMEYTKSNGKVRIASAKRPFVVIKDGVKQVINGDRYSIGGFMEEDKKFTNREFFLNKGDKIYLYSDGIVDQFGGPRGKKLKHKGFLEIIDKVYPEDMYKQNDLIKKDFTSWINGYEQIDDIIVIGIEI